MKTLTLIEVPKYHPSRKQRLDKFKLEHGIETHFSHACDPAPWLACHMPTARKFGYGVNETSTLFDCVSHVGRLLQESGVLDEAKTEWLAVQKVCENRDIKFNP